METDRFKALYQLHPKVKAIIKEFLSGERRRKISGYLARVDEDQVQFLQLFASPAPLESDAAQHPRLPSRVYEAGKRLIRNEVLVDETDPSAEYKEKVRLAPDAVSVVEERILKGKIQRDSITLELDNIDASNRGGSGAPPNSYKRY